MTREGTSPFDPRDPRWKTCLVGCRPAAGMHRPDCPNVAAATSRERVDCTYTLAAVRKMGWLPPGEVARLYAARDQAEQAIDTLLAVIPALVVNASKSAHQSWLDGRTPVVTEDTVRGELLRIIGGSS